MLTRETLVAIMPRASSVADRVTPALQTTMTRYAINTPARIAAFLAQLAHESGQFQHWSENLSYRWQRLRQVFPKYFRSDAEAQAFDRKPERIANRVYANRMGNGPETSGDGWRYRGRGPIQLTGKDNYRQCGAEIGIDLVGEPERLETPDGGCLAAGWFWDKRGLNSLADAGDFVAITKRINGGVIGLEERQGFWERAKAVLGVGAPAAVAAGPRRTASAPNKRRSATPTKTRASRKKRSPGPKRLPVRARRGGVALGKSKTPRGRRKQSVRPKRATVRRPKGKGTRVGRARLRKAARQKR